MRGAIPLLTAIISLLFAVVVLDQFLERRRPYQLIWTFALVLYALSSFMAFLVETRGLAQFPYRLWYAVGAGLVAAYLGTGSVFLLASPSVARTILAVLGALTVIYVFLVFTVPLRQPLEALEGRPLTGRGFFPPQVVVLTVLLNVYGTIALVGGALWSAVRYAQRGAPGYRVSAMVLIALGGLISAAGGTLARFGVPEPHALALLLGVIVIFLGVLRANPRFGVTRFPLIHALRRV